MYSLFQEGRKMKNTAFLIKENHCPKDYRLKKSPDSDSAMGVAKRILAEVMIFRRVPETISLCGTGCQKCASPHLPKIISAVNKNEPVTFILPAFPGKSPNPEKVLGPLPDHAERLSLNFLGTLCRRIKTFYTPGIKMILCSDGRVFSDVVGMNESDVTAYQLELDRLIKEMSLADLSTFNLDYFYKDLHFVQMREELMKNYGQSLDFLKQKIRNGAKPSASPDEQEANRMYSGITRFLFEDAMHAGQTKSRTAIQKESRSKAYEVIRRSNAWSALISEHFPGAVRLSIHPQTCGSKKLGIRLIGNESWMTPWHGVAVESKKGYVLLKRSEAEALGAKLICSSDGRHSHYQLMAEVSYEL
ncbi:TPA: L-tyrosine/L-tryptophan isonitrile synthase family protein [Legionella pneumophila]|nr:L-tyrosine/L-tryptophan isonitrile synthase family protein [Legionella pneumophila]HAT9116947.1 L-tyrosine/L-tryptophan isonitrile synthase family protein [Legionella pneumophila subsp. pneumophila]HAT7969211.1 L-tyrosine/L-tryptophan isonitrile synthase family protein [Legionella pneumophila]HAT8325210.1 L-tyrosine/L-tryptophan isonitrile synthase family protein [Legionella pneumophila]HAT8330876.1 L-tyrosine/L-tryptophan isonitrile synthase family protein [Legionella pneumophila]